MHQLSVSSRESKSILLVDRENSNCEFLSILSEMDSRETKFRKLYNNINQDTFISLMICRLSNQRYKQADQRNDGRAINAVKH